MKPVRPTQWAVVRKDGTIYSSWESKAFAEKELQYAESCRVVRLVEYSPALEAVGRAAVATATYNGAENWDKLILAVKRLQRERKRKPKNGPKRV
jgi:hypothetical protein